MTYILIILAHRYNDQTLLKPFIIQLLPTRSTTMFTVLRTEPSMSEIFLSTEEKDTNE